MQLIHRMDRSWKGKIEEREIERKQTICFAKRMVGIIQTIRFLFLFLSEDNFLTSSSPFYHIHFLSFLFHLTFYSRFLLFHLDDMAFFFFVRLHFSSFSFSSVSFSPSFLDNFWILFSPLFFMVKSPYLFF